jgi:hypothetical protein
MRSKEKLPLQTTTLIADLLLRNGSATARSLSPYDGYLIETLRQLPNFSGEYKKMIECAADYNSEKQGQASRRIEDIPASDVYRYASNVLTVLKINRNGVKAYNKQHGETESFQDNETGEIINESESAIASENGYSTLDTALAAERLPFLLRRLWLAGKNFHVNLISLMIAWRRALSLYPGKTLHARHLIDCGFFESDNWISVGENANKQLHIKQAIDWVLGNHNRTCEDYNAMIELVSVCGKLGIELEDDNAKLYDSGFFSRLIVTYLPSNKEYLKITETEIQDPRLLTISAFVDTGHGESEACENIVSEFYNAYNKKYNTNLDITKQYTKNGFLHYSKEQCPVYLDVESASLSTTHALININGKGYIYMDGRMFFTLLSSLTSHIKNGTRGEWDFVWC